MKICSEANRDRLTFYIDNTSMEVWSGVEDWSLKSFPVTAGTHKFKWIYMKDGSSSYGDDCCWIDDVQFPASKTFMLLPAFELNVQVFENEVTLSWPEQKPDDNYLIRRNGIPIAMQHDTIFTQLLNLGTYTYSVTAVNSDGEQSVPAFATVEITVLGIDSIENELQVFPNPVRNWLNVSFGQPFRYSLFNNIGMRIKEGQSSGTLRMDCGMLPQGVYILQISADDRVIVKKIIVQ